ncbi:hypothetical protein [Streptomyces sp. NRRL F-5123]|uniref:hypothetical protein n=1 Tax=Streptomyces sp. NRRL F-5123 TaxID=1463856 RepID=UPI00131E6A0B|nr:hypothetical protein [Streptomyces sp. NRRL F-5123]
MNTRMRTLGRFERKNGRRWAAVAAGCLLAVVPLTAAHADGVPAPAVPTEQGIVQGSGVMCAGDESAPGVVASPRPQLTARVHGAADGAQPPRLRADFDVASRNVDGSWTPVANQLAPSAGFVGDGVVETTTLVTTLSTGTVYRISAVTWAYASDQTQYTASGATEYCYFTVDPTGPLAPGVTYGGPYSECTADDCGPHGGAGVPGTFTFAPADGDSPVVGYRYKFATDSTWTIVAGSPATVVFTPPYATFEQLQVSALDVLGRYGSTTTTEFMVG